jgi:hypothetical protein
LWERFWNLIKCSHDKITTSFFLVPKHITYWMIVNDWKLEMRLILFKGVTINNKNLSKHKETLESNINRVWSNITMLRLLYMHNFKQSLAL